MNIHRKPKLLAKNFKVQSIIIVALFKTALAIQSLSNMPFSYKKDV